MAAEARVFLEPVARRDEAGPMPEQPAQVAHLFLEGRRRRVRIVLRIKQQRMPALRADVFVTAVASGELLVIVLAEKTRQGVPDVRQRAILGEVVRAASAFPAAAFCLFENVVVHVMTEQKTRQFCQSFHKDAL